MGRFLIAGLGVAMATGAVSATTYEWPGGSGSWTDPGWTTNGVPATPVWDGNADAYLLGGIVGLTPSANPGTAIHDIYLKPGDGSATLNISGDLSGRTILLGHDGDSGSATVNQTAGTVATTGYDYIGYKGTSTNTYNLSGGIWNAGGARFYIGENAGSSGTLVVDGGTLNASGALFALGYYNGGSGILRLDGGTIHHTASGSGTYFLVGRSGNGVLDMSGGMLESAAQKFALGYYDTSSGTMNLNGGLLRFTGDYFYVGMAGSGTLHQSGGTNETTGLIIADQGGSDGLYSISGGRLAASKYFYLHTANAVFEVDGSGADSIEAGAILAPAGTIRFNLDKNGTTPMKAVGGYNGRGIELDGATVEIEPLAGFSGEIGDTCDLMWSANGFITDGMVFTNLGSVNLGWDIVPENGGETMRLVVLPEPAPQPLRLMSYNIHHCENSNGVVNLSATAEVIGASDPDLVALQEVDKNTSRSGNVDQARELANALGMEYRFGKAIDYQGGEYGVAILSRFPILSDSLYSLPNPSNAEQRVALEIQVAVPDVRGRTNTLSFVCTHLDSTSDATRQDQAQAVVNAFAPLKHPVALAGDLNAEPDEAPIDLLRSAGYACLDREEKPTFHADSPTKKIDYVLVRTAELPLASAPVTVVVEKAASDHRPVVADLLLNAPAEWLAEYGLPQSDLQGFVDSDGDGMDNYSEWLTGTDPTNALSFFGIQPSGSGAVPTGFQLQWNSVTQRTYRVEASTNLIDGVFQTLESGIQGLEGSTEFIDTNAAGKAQAFYRVILEN